MQATPPSVPSAASAGQHPRVPATQPLELTLGQRPWLVGVFRMLARVLTQPVRSFAKCPEPVRHSSVLAALVTLRLPLWVATLVAWQVHRMTTEPFRRPWLPVHALLDPALAEALAAWLTLMIPLGLPLLYVGLGLLAHVGIALTGGAPRSIAASMRAVGYALAPALLCVSIGDFALALGYPHGKPHLAGLAVVVAYSWVWVGLALASTHGIGRFRGFIVALPPIACFAAVTLLRAALLIDWLPGIEAVPPSPYMLP